MRWRGPLVAALALAVALLAGPARADSIEAWNRQALAFKRVQFVAVQSNAAQIEAMRAGRLHVAASNTGSVPLAVNCSGFVPFAMMASRDGRFGYNLEIIVQAQGPIQRIEDLRGRLVAFTAQTSNSGFKAPSALLERHFGLRAEHDCRTAFSGRHDNSILGVANRDHEAAAIANSVLTRMVARNAVAPARLRTVYRSEPFPTSAYGHAHNLTPALAAGVRRAFETFAWDATALQREFQRNEPPAETFIAITCREQWSVVRQIGAATGVSYACR